MGKSITKDDRFAFLSTALLMFITHGFCFANLLFSHDSLYFFDTYYATKVNLGRWLYPLLLLLRNFTTPWMMGILGTVYVSLAVVLVVRLFGFDRIKSICVAVLFSTNIAIIALFGTYSIDVDADCLALLLSCFAVYSFDRFSGKKRIIISICSLVGVLAFYQAYICVSIGLFIILLIYRAAQCRNDEEVRIVFKTGINDIVLLFASSVIYLVLMIAAGFLFGVGIDNQYNGPGSLAQTGFLSHLIAIPKAYVFFIKRMVRPDARNNFMVLAATMVLFVLTVITFVRFIRHKGMYKGSLKIIIPCLVILPLGLNAIYVITSGMVHQLMIFAFALIFLLPIVMTDIIPDPDGKDEGEKSSDTKKRLYMTALAAIMVIGLNNIVFANGVYTYKKLVYDNTLLHAQKVWEDVNCLEGYEEGKTPVVFVGEFNESKAAYNGYIENRFRDSLLGSQGSSITYEDSLIHYYEGVLGRGMLIEHCDQAGLDTQVISAMPEYPKDGYCIMDGEKVIVKMAEQSGNQ